MCHETSVIAKDFKAQNIGILMSTCLFHQTDKLTHMYILYNFSQIDVLMSSQVRNIKLDLFTLLHAMLTDLTPVSNVTSSTPVI